MTPDEAATLARDWQPRVRAFFTRRCRCREDVEDLSQEALAAVVRCYAAFAHRSSLSTWIYAVCRNVYSNFVYYRSRDARLLQRLGEPPRAEDPSLAGALAASLGRLGREERTLYTLFYVQGLSVREVARVLGRPEGTVKYLLFRLRTRVRELVES
jgi:RNA polymerase sigma-70 factor, ECF subfamily